MKTLVISQYEDEYSEWAARYGDATVGYEFRDVEPTIRRREVDVVLFTGGADVCPMLYGEVADYRTMSNQRRDWREMGIYRLCERAGVSTFGICRGAQFIGVMRGAVLRQHIGGHAIPGTHYAHRYCPGVPVSQSLQEYFPDGYTPDTIVCNSTHHQAVHLGSAVMSRAHILYTADADVEGQNVQIVEAATWETGLRRDAVVQWHPEYMQQKEEAHQIAGSLLRWAGRD